MKGWLDAMLANLIIIYGAAIAVIGVLAAALAVKHWWSSNPFHYPYLYIDFDVSGKRNPDPYDYLDEYLCQPNALKAIVAHEKRVERWKEEEAERAGKMPFPEHRREQLSAAADDAHSYRVRLKRNQTRYSQRNYVKTPYTVVTVDKELGIDKDAVMQRHAQLAAIGFETTLRKYRSKEQRKLMTPELRRRVMQRDDYTCQICGKRMPDGGGAARGPDRAHRQRREDRGVEPASAVLQVQREKRRERLRRGRYVPELSLRAVYAMTRAAFSYAGALRGQPARVHSGTREAGQGAGRGRGLVARSGSANHHELGQEGRLGEVLVRHEPLGHSFSYYSTLMTSVGAYRLS